MLNPFLVILQSFHSFPLSFAFTCLFT